VVRQLTDKHEIRTRLESDRDWALYALADLDEGMFEQSEWWGSGDGLALVFHGLAIRPIFVMGELGDVRELLSALPTESGYLNLQAHAVEAADGRFIYRDRRDMHRMILDAFVPRAGSAEPLTPMDRAVIEALFATGDGAGVAFMPSQLATGYFRGVRERGELVAVAGIHVVSILEGVAGVGNVFVRSDRRGRGLAQVVLSATVAAVRRAGVRTIGLNVEHSNIAAIHAYHNLGFRTRVRYFEGTADRVASAR
jgi:ribosomal protein S18 acetylase RimI-like enzyme